MMLVLLTRKLWRFVRLCQLKVPFSTMDWWQKLLAIPEILPFCFGWLLADDRLVILGRKLDRIRVRGKEGTVLF